MSLLWEIFCRVPVPRRGKEWYGRSLVLPRHGKGHYGRSLAVPVRDTELGCRGSGFEAVAPKCGSCCTSGCAWLVYRTQPLHENGHSYQIQCLQPEAMQAGPGIDSALCYYCGSPRKLECLNPLGVVSWALEGVWQAIAVAATQEWCLAMN